MISYAFEVTEDKNGFKKTSGSIHQVVYIIMAKRDQKKTGQTLSQSKQDFEWEVILKSEKF